PWTTPLTTWRWWDTTSTSSSIPQPASPRLFTVARVGPTASSHWMTMLTWSKKFLLTVRRMNQSASSQTGSSPSRTNPKAYFRTCARLTLPRSLPFAFRSYGLAAVRPPHRVSARLVGWFFDYIRLLHIDSFSVFSPTHYFPF